MIYCPGSSFWNWILHLMQHYADLLFSFCQNGAERHVTLFQIYQLNVFELIK